MRPVKSKKFSLISIHGSSLSVQSVCVLCTSGTSCRATQRNHQTGSTIATRAYDYLERVDAEWEQPHTYAACQKAADPGQTIVQIRVLPVCIRMRVGTTLRQAYAHHELASGALHFDRRRAQLLMEQPRCPNGATDTISTRADTPMIR